MNIHCWETELVCVCIGGSDCCGTARAVQPIYPYILTLCSKFSSFNLCIFYLQIKEVITLPFCKYYVGIKALVIFLVVEEVQEQQY